MLAIAVIKNTKFDRLLFGFFVGLFSFAMGCNDGKRETKLTGNVVGGHAPYCVHENAHTSKRCICALHYAIVRKDVKEVQNLLEQHSVDANRRYKKVLSVNSISYVQSCTPLFQAVMLGDGDDVVAMVRFLIAHGADVNAREFTHRDDAETILHRVVAKQHISVMRELIQCGKLNLTERCCGRTALELADRLKEDFKTETAREIFQLLSSITPPSIP